MTPYAIRFFILRRSLNLTQAQFATKLRVSRSTINAIERGRMPALKTLEALAKLEARYKL